MTPLINQKLYPKFHDSDALNNSTIVSKTERNTYSYRVDSESIKIYGSREVLWFSLPALMRTYSNTWSSLKRWLEKSFLITCCVLFYGLVRAGAHPRQDGHRANVRPRFNANILSTGFNANIFVQTHDPQSNDDWKKCNYMLFVILWLGKSRHTPRAIWP